MAKLIGDYERIAETLGRMTSFTELAFAADMSDPEVGQQAQMMRELESEISAMLVFVERLAQIEDAQMNAMMSAPSMAYWARGSELCGFRPHQLSDELETMLIERQPSGRAAWVRL